MKEDVATYKSGNSTIIAHFPLATPDVPEGLVERNRRSFEQTLSNVLSENCGQKVKATVDWSPAASNWDIKLLEKRQGEISDSEELPQILRGVPFQVREIDTVR